jgi:hypothetical protein
MYRAICLHFAADYLLTVALNHFARRMVVEPVVLVASLVVGDKTLVREFRVVTS